MDQGGPIERGEALNIYALKMNQGVFSWSILKLGVECEMCPVPGLADMRLSLAESGKAVSEELNSVGWVFIWRILSGCLAGF